MGQQINEKIEDVDKNIKRFINAQNQELRENIYGRMEQVNEIINQKMDGNTEERRQEIDKTNERIEQINETTEQNRVNLCSKIDQVKEDSHVQIETIQREQVALLSEFKPNINKENIKHREMKSNKMRRMHSRNLIKTQEEYEMMHSGLILSLIHI